MSVLSHPLTLSDRFVFVYYSCLDFMWAQTLFYTILYPLTFLLIIFFFSSFFDLSCFECQDDVLITAFSVFDHL
jgi:hypothetical protein